MGLGRKKRPKLTKQEYKILSGQAIAKFGSKQAIATGYTSNDYVVYNHLGDGEIEAMAKIAIEGNEEVIDIMERLYERSDDK